MAVIHRTSDSNGGTIRTISLSNALAAGGLLLTLLGIVGTWAYASSAIPTRVAVEVERRIEARLTMEKEAARAVHEHLQSQITGNSAKLSIIENRLYEQHVRRQPPALP